MASRSESSNFSTSSDNVTDISSVENVNVTLRRGRGRPRGSGKGRGRGKSTNRGRGRGRGSRRGRGVVAGRSSMDANSERILSLQLARDNYLQNIVENMDVQQMRDVLLDVAKRQPGMLAGIVNSQVSQPPPQSTNSPEWCSCGRCRQMPTFEEMVCCRQTPDNCLTLSPEIGMYILDPGVLNLANMYRNDFFGLPLQQDNKPLRHAAYRQFVMWRYGYMGSGRRTPIPSCCVWIIRDKFPEESGQYTGYTPGRLL